MNKYKTLAITNRMPGVSQINMNRPEVFNAFDDTMIEDLNAAFDSLMDDQAVRVIILAGSGKHFSAGADLQWMQRASNATQEWNLEDARKFASMLGKIDTCPKPTVARVQGAALGGGTGLICACDVAIAANNAYFAVSETKFGILPAVIGPYLTNAVGKRHARRLALSTTRIYADEALRIGLIHQLTAIETLDGMIDEILHDILTGGPVAQQEIKNLYARFDVGPISEEVRELTAQTISRVRGTKEAREGFSAFLEKRRAKWIPE